MLMLTSCCTLDSVPPTHSRRQIPAYSTQALQLSMLRLATDLMKPMQ